MNIYELMELPFEEKLEVTRDLINCWYEAWDGKVFVSYSGGKDSTVLLHIVREMFPEVPGVFCNTGLEYPEIVKFVKNTPNVRWVKPKKRFGQVIKEYGWPVVSKLTALKIRRLQNETEKNKNVCRLYRTGYNSKGEYRRRWKLPKKWFFLIDAPFKISERCCDVLKKSPLNTFANKNKMYPMIGTMVTDSQARKMTFTKKACNAYDARWPTSNPMAFWTEDEVWQYIRDNDLPYCEIYDMGWDRTGCVFCMFGIHMEDEPNRFQKLKTTHPKLWKYCMEKLGAKEVMEYLGFPVE